MGWERPHWLGVETYDELIERDRERRDPDPGVSGYDEARAGRADDLAPAAPFPLGQQPATPPSPVAGATGPAAARLGGNQSERQQPDHPHAA